MEMKKLVSRCGECNGITFMAVYDTVEDIVDAAASVKRLKKEGRWVDVILHQAGDKMPGWCNCNGRTN
jgi:hypothetical protein